MREKMFLSVLRKAPMRCKLKIPDVPGVGTWALLSGSGSIDDVNDPNATISGLIVGANTFSWTVYNGPCEVPYTG
jgi:hypothetical protein